MLDQETQTLLTDVDQLRLREWLENMPWRENRRSPDVGELRQKVGQAGVIAQRDVPRDRVTMNSLVGLRDLTLNEKLTCTLVYPHEADLARHKVPVTVPMGTQMLGRRVGDTLDCQVSTGTRQLRIERVFYQPEAAGDFHL